MSLEKPRGLTDRLVWYVLVAPMLLIVVLGGYLPGLWTIPPVDRDESRFAQASRQMLESVTLPASELDLRRGESGVPLGLHSGGWAVPMFGETPRLNKPPLIYWLQASSAWLFSGGDPKNDAIWMYRVPSVVCATLSLLGVAMLGRAMFGGHVELLAMALLAASPMMIWDAHQARSDQLLTFTTLLTMAALWSIWSRRGRAPSVLGDHARAVGFWFAMGLGILSKGPITPMVAGLAIVTLCAIGGARAPGMRWSWLWRLKPHVGVIVVGLVVTPWLIAIDRAIGLGPYWAIVYDEFFVRGASGSREGHFAPPGFHLVLSAVLLWPGSLVLIDAVRAAWRGRVRAAAQGPKVATAPTSGGFAPAPWWRCWLPVARQNTALFLIAWLVPSWVVFELSPAKLPHYVMPLYPAACLLCARMLVSMDIAARTQERLGIALPKKLNIGQWVCVGIGGLGFAMFALGGVACLVPGALPGEPKGLIGISLLALCPVFGIGVFRLANALRTRDASKIVTLGLFLMIGIVFCPMKLLGPELLPGSQTARLMTPLRTTYEKLRVSAEVPPPIASVYHEDSVVFWSRGRVERLHTLKMPEWLAAHPAGAAIIDERQLEDAIKLGFVSIHRERGENSTMPKGERATVLHVVVGPGILMRPESAPVP